MSCVKIGKKLLTLPTYAQELNFKILIENKLGNLILFEKWKSENLVEIKQAERKFGKIKYRFQPHLMVINNNSESTPIRLCTTSNTLSAIENNQGKSSGSENLPKTLAYNDSV